MSVENKIEQLRKFDAAYFAGEPLIPDVQYDALKESVRAESPEHQYFSEVGHDERAGKVDLPYTMGSLNQVHTGEFSKWIEKYDISQCVVSQKLDGTSCMLIYEGIEGSGEARLTAAYSRGNGIQGASIIRHIKHMPTVPKKIKGTHYLAVRGEIILPNGVFFNKYATKYKNARQMAAGCMNRKVTSKEILRDIDFVAYTIVDCATPLDFIGPEDTAALRFTALSRAGFRSAQMGLYNSRDLNDGKLSKLLDEYRSTTDYALDGLVITSNNLEVTKLTKSSSLNPEHSVKFKEVSADNMVSTRVVAVHWKLSKSGFWKPRIEIEPVELFGTTVTFATGFNGKFIHDNMIDVGAKVVVTKAGEVIPYVLGVEEPAKTFSTPAETWDWDEMGVEFIAPANNSERVVMQLVHFFKTLEVEYLQETSLRKVLNYYSHLDASNGFEDTVVEIIGLMEHEWKNVIGENGVKIYMSLHKKLGALKPEKLLGACPFFGLGFGVRKAKKIMKEMSLGEFFEVTPKDIRNIEGFDETSETVHSGIARFSDFYNSIKDYVTFVEEETTNTLKDHVIVMTGFRDKELQERIELSGGRVSSAVSGKTTVVIAADVNSTSGKVKKARDLGVEVLSINEFNLRYIL